MEALVLIGGFVYIGVLGFWVMGKIDRFIDRGGFTPDWDEEEPQSTAKVSKEYPAAYGQKIAAKRINQ